VRRRLPAPGMHPFRHSIATKSTSLPDAEETILYAVFLVIGAIPVAIALVQDATFGFDATMGLLMVAAGALGMCAQLVRFVRGTGQPAGPSAGGSRHR
jgi:hypothetical protein